MMSRVDECFETVTLLEIDFWRNMRLIRQLDLAVEADLEFLFKWQLIWKSRLDHKDEMYLDKSQLSLERDQLRGLQKQSYGLCLEKVCVAEQLLEYIDMTLAELGQRLQQAPAQVHTEVVEKQTLSRSKRLSKTTKSRRGKGKDVVCFQLDMFQKKKGRERGSVRVVDLCSPSTDHGY